MKPQVTAIIQCAMNMEAQPILSQMDPESLEIWQIPSGNDEQAAGGDAVADASDNQDRHRQLFIMGTIGDHSVLLVCSGIGIANAASATARALMLVDASQIIVAGTTGGLSVDINVRDIAVGTQVTYHSADATAFGYARGQVPQMPVDYRSSEAMLTRASTFAAAFMNNGKASDETGVARIGGIVSGDSFITAANVAEIRQAFPDAVGTDMETAAIAQVAWSMGVDWISLRAVSDLCGPAAGQDFHIDGEIAAAVSAEAVRDFLALL